jgi:hypothetical protein
MVHSQILSEKAILSIIGFKRPDRIVRIDSKVSDVKIGLCGYLWTKQNIIFVLEIVIDVVHAVWIYHRIDEVVREVEAVVICSKQGVDICLRSARSAGVRGIITRIYIECNLFVVVSRIFSIDFVAGADWRTQPSAHTERIEIFHNVGEAGPMFRSALDEL